MLDELYEMYLGELYGISFFTYFAKHYPERREVWQTLIQVEQVTAQHLLRALLQHGRCALPTTTTERDLQAAMQAKGVQDAQKWIHLPWYTLMTTLAEWVSPYQQHYQKCAENATDLHHVYEIVTQHETAIYHFLLAEESSSKNDDDGKKDDDSKSSVEFLHTYLTTYGTHQGCVLSK